MLSHRSSPNTENQPFKLLLRIRAVVIFLFQLHGDGVIAYMKKNGLTTLGKYFEKQKSAMTDVLDNSPHNIDLPSNAVFQSLNPSDTINNTGIMKKLGLEINEEQMARISRVFDGMRHLVLQMPRAVWKSPFQNTRNYFVHFDGLRYKLPGIEKSAHLFTRNYSG